jgi:hypothetical protein
MPFDVIFDIGETWIRIDAAIADTLMRSSVIGEVARDVDGVPQAVITEEAEVVQAFGKRLADFSAESSCQTGADGTLFVCDKRPVRLRCCGGGRAYFAAFFA